MDVGDKQWVEVIADDYFKGSKGKIVKVGRGPYQTYYDVKVRSKFLPKDYIITLLHHEIKEVTA